MAFIIDTYSKFNRWDREHAVHIFTVNEVWYAIKEVELEWGMPILPEKVDSDTRPSSYFIYGSKEEALRFVSLMKSLN